MSINFDDLSIRLADFAHKPSVDLSGSSDEKTQKVLNILYETVITSEGKNLVERRYILEKADAIAKEVDKGKTGPNEMVALCRNFLSTKYSEVTKQLDAAEEKRISELVGRFQEGVETLLKDINTYKDLPGELHPITINRRLVELLDILPKNVSRYILNSTDYSGVKEIFFKTLPSVLKMDSVNDAERIKDSIACANALDPESTSNALTSQLKEYVADFNNHVAGLSASIPVLVQKFDEHLQKCIQAKKQIDDLARLIKKQTPDYDLPDALSEMSKFSDFNAAKAANQRLLAQMEAFAKLGNDFTRTPPGKLLDKIEGYNKELIPFFRGMAEIKKILPEFNVVDSPLVNALYVALNGMKAFRALGFDAMSKAEANQVIDKLTDNQRFVYFNTDENAWMLAAFSDSDGNRKAIHLKLSIGGMQKLDSQKNVLLQPEIAAIRKSL